jgi:hypothetical protein
VLAPIVSETVAVWLYPPLVAVTVRVLVPVGVPAVVVMAIVEYTGLMPSRLNVLGPKVGVAPAGSPATDRLTGPAKPYAELVTTVYWAVPTPVRVSDGGDVETVKSAVPCMLTSTSAHTMWSTPVEPPLFTLIYPELSIVDGRSAGGSGVDSHVHFKRRSTAYNKTDPITVGVKSDLKNPRKNGVMVPL